MNSARAFAFRVFPALLLIVSGTFASAEEPTPAEIYAAIRAQFTHIKTLDVPSRAATFWGEAEPDLSWTVDTTEDRAGDYIRFFKIETRRSWQKGEFFRNYVKTPDEETEFAYDGSRYQQFERRSRGLRLLNESFAADTIEMFQYTSNIHFLQPYEFAVRVTEAAEVVTMGLLRDEAFWASVAKLSKVHGADTVDGHPCVVVDITNLEHKRHGELHARVYFAKDLSYYPVRYDLYIGDDIYHTFLANDVQRARHCGKKIEGAPVNYFAGRSVLRHYDQMGSGRPEGGSVYEVDTEWTNVNCTIPDAFFTIAPSEALYVRDDRSTD